MRVVGSGLRLTRGPQRGTRSGRSCAFTSFADRMPSRISAHFTGLRVSSCPVARARFNGVRKRRGCRSCRQPARVSSVRVREFVLTLGGSGIIEQRLHGITVRPTCADGVVVDRRTTRSVIPIACWRNPGNHSMRWRTTPRATQPCGGAGSSTLQARSLYRLW